MVLLTCNENLMNWLSGQRSGQRSDNIDLTKWKTLHFGNGNLQLDYQMNGHILEHFNDDRDLGSLH